jgi:thiamine kinase-like enzyme
MFRGPFETENGIIHALVDKARYSRQRFDPIYERANFFESALTEVLRDHEVVFTHSDLHPGNFIVHDDRKGVVIIDWAFSGWYPSCWENCTALFRCLDFEDDWHAWVGKILDYSYAEYAWLYLVRENQFA